MIRPFVLVVLLLLAGCADEPNADECGLAYAIVDSPCPPVSSVSAPTPAPTPPVVYAKHNTTTLGIFANPTITPGEGDHFGVSFNTTADVRAIMVEVAWNDTVQDLDAYLKADVEECPYDDSLEDLACNVDNWSYQYEFGVFQNKNGSPGMGDSPSRVLLDGDDLAEVIDACEGTCNWRALPWGRAPFADLEWHMWVSVFYEDVPEGYTAIPWP